MPDVVEVLAADDTEVRPGARALVWPAGATSDTVDSDLDWQLSGLGAVRPAALDLARIACAAYLADRTVKRSTTYFSRQLHLVVHLDEPALFLSAAGQQLMDLLAWLTGDAWTLTPVGNGSTASPTRAAVEPRSAVALLSGGMDSLCGAIAHFPEQSNRLHLGHRDHAGAVVRSQDAIAGRLTELAADFAWQRVRITTRHSSESSTRTRSLMFMALAVAAATARGASRVIVPENGFTSLNPALLPSRGGALSTKSTHPWTFLQVNSLVRALGLDVTLDNPFGLHSKGQLLAEAAAAGVPTLDGLHEESISCSKLDGGRGLRGGNPNLNCGLCIACLVRRGAFVGAALSDPTEYLTDLLTGSARAKLVERRHSDIWAVQSWALRTPTIDDLVTAAPWPAGTDYDAMLEVVNRGRGELLEALDVAL